MSRLFLRILVPSAVVALGACASRHAQSTPSPGVFQPQPEKPAETSTKSPESLIAPAVDRGIEIILGLQEGDEKAEWPYEGVYRVDGQIPIGYRVGGTAISATALLLAPGYATDQARLGAVARACAFVIEGIDHPLMNPDYDGGYDVRGWGYTYGLSFLLDLKVAVGVPQDLAPGAEKAIQFYIDAIQRTEIAQVGGWNYARPIGRDKVAPPSPFMTAPTLQALFKARAAGYTVDERVVGRAIACLESARSASGAFVYSGDAAAARRDQIPGAVGRMVASETTLLLAGRSSVADVRGAIDSFIVHWQWLDKRRAQPGTHVPPYMIAPYYFYYAHYYAAQAVEMLPEPERAEYRRRINDLLFSVRLADGSWNDRVFPRSANFGTSMAVMALLMPQLPAPARWSEGKIQGH